MMFRLCVSILWIGIRRIMIPYLKSFPSLVMIPGTRPLSTVWWTWSLTRTGSSRADSGPSWSALSATSKLSRSQVKSLLKKVFKQILLVTSPWQSKVTYFFLWQVILVLQKARIQISWQRMKPWSPRCLFTCFSWCSSTLTASTRARTCGTDQPGSSTTRQELLVKDCIPQCVFSIIAATTTPTNTLMEKLWSS